MKNRIIFTSDIESTDMRGIIKEIEQNERMSSVVDRSSVELGVADGDMIEAIASHIMYTDTDYDLDKEIEYRTANK